MDEHKKAKAQKTGRLKVLYLPKWYPNRYDPMPGLFIERHGRAAAAYDDIAVLYVHPDDQMRGKKFEIESFSDDELFQVKIYFKLSRSLPGLRQLINACRFFKAHRKGFKIIYKEFGKPDLHHVHVLTRHGIVAWMQKINLGTPYVITEHWTRYLQSTLSFNGWARKYFTRKVVKGAAAVMPVTYNLQKAMESHGLNNPNYVIIPNVVDIKMFTPEEKDVAGEATDIVHVSCFEDKQKNISGLLRVLKKLSEQRQDWKIQMIGDGIHFDQLKDYADELGVKDKFVFFQGLKENEELVKFMQTADFQVMFSRYENLPVVILESYACGVPVLSTDVGGIAEHLNEDLGILIDSEDEEALFESLNKMIDQKTNYDKSGIRKYAEEHFSNEVIGRQLDEVYRQATAK